MLTGRATMANRRMSFAKSALSTVTPVFVFLVILPLTWAAWVVLLFGIGSATGSGLGSCGLYGDSAFLLVSFLLIGFIVTPVFAFSLTRLILRRVRGRAPGAVETQH